MLRKTATMTIVAVLGAGAAFGVAACGEDEGQLQIEGTETTGTATTGTGTTGGSGTETTGTGTSPTRY
jgi:hypothetical protein